MIADDVLAAVDIDVAVRRHRRETRQRRLIADVEDHIGDLHVWPYKEQRLVLSRRPIGRGAMFLLGNHAPPRPVAALLVGLGLLPSAKKRRDAWDVLRAFRDGTLRNDAFYWCLQTNTCRRVDVSWSMASVSVSSTVLVEAVAADASSSTENEPRRE